VAEIPSELTSFVGACEGGGHCVPDEFIRTGGVFTPISCTSLNGPGVCLSRCIPEVEANAALLPQDICKDHELCTPCVHPIEGTETGACDLAFTCGAPPDSPGGPTGGGDDPATCVHEGAPVLDPASLPACETCGGGHCVDGALLPQDLVGSLDRCTDTSYCVPDAFIVTGGDFLLDSCVSVAGAEGRCASTCLPDVAAQAESLPQSSCPDEHRCVPCYDPLDGAPTGICNLSCDAGPTKPPTTLPRCCAEVGQCVPAELVPPDQADRFSEDTCPQDGGALTCVPDIFLGGSYTPMPCETSWIAFFFGEEYRPGACLPACLPDVDGTFGLAQDGCPEEFKCVPCLDPTGDGSTGACESQ
jgi:hypothetical protein